MPGALPAGIGYSPGLDGIRALAALTIVVYHARPPTLTGGFFGVDIFFVLSGYLITRLLVAEYAARQTLDYRAFMVRRLRRLLPAFWVFLLAYLLLVPWLFPEASWLRHLRDASWSAVYMVNYAAALGEPVVVLAHVWSLAVEMQFYLLWPLILYGLLRLPRKTALSLLVLLYFFATAWRWWAIDNLDGVWDFYIRADTHSSGLVLGGVLGLWNRRINAQWTWLACLMLAFAMTFYSTHWVPSGRYGFTIVELAAGLLILSQPAWLGNRLLVWLGTMSYGLYLWHYLPMRALRAMDWPWEMVLLVGATVGLVAAAASYYLIERRFYRRRVEGGAS